MKLVQTSKRTETYHSKNYSTDISRDRFVILLVESIIKFLFGIERFETYTEPLLVALIGDSPVQEATTEIYPNGLWKYVQQLYEDWNPNKVRVGFEENEKK